MFWYKLKQNLNNGHLNLPNVTEIIYIGSNKQNRKNRQDQL